MKKTLIALAAVTAMTGVAAPAFAQPGYDRYDRDNRYEQNGRRYEDSYDRNRRLDVTDRLERRIQKAYERRRISQTEYRNLRVQVRELERLERYYLRDDGRLGRREAEDIRRRADRIQMQLREDRRDRDEWNNYWNNYFGNGYRR